MAILPPWHMLAIISRSACGLPDISRPTSKPSIMPSCFCTSASGVSFGLTRQRRAHLARQLQPEGIQIRHHHMPRAGMPHHRNRHDADRAGAGDQHVLAQHREGKRRVHRVAEGIEDGRHFAGRCRDVPPDIGHGQRNQFGEGPGAVDAHALRRSAQMPPPGQAVAAAAAHHVALAADDVAGIEVVHVRSDGDDLAHELMADRHGHGNRLLRPLVPLVDVHVGAADAG